MTMKPNWNTNQSLALGSSRNNPGATHSRRSKWLGLVAAAVSLTAAPAMAATWVGYMNVFNTAAGTKGGYVFGSGWGVADLKTTVSVLGSGMDQLILQPNYNTYADNAGDAFWRNNDGAGPDGNKWMEANTYVETASIAVSTFSFSGIVGSFTLNSNYVAEAFIKVLDPNSGYATVLNDRVALPASGAFEIHSDLANYQGMILQTGFTIEGLNANPDAEASLGNVTVTVVPEPSAALLGVLGLAGILRRRRN